MFNTHDAFIESDISIHVTHSMNQILTEFMIGTKENINYKKKLSIYNKKLSLQSPLLNIV